MSTETISRLENYQRKPQVQTLNKLAATLGVTVSELAEDLMREEVSVEKIETREKTEVEIRWVDHAANQYRGEILRFRGDIVDHYEEGIDYTVTLYQCPTGYRVYEENIPDGLANQSATLHPSQTNPHTGETEYPTYTAEELVEDFPAFGSEVGVYRVRDID